MFLGNKVIAYRAAHFLSSFRAHLRQPEGRNGKRLYAGNMGKISPEYPWNEILLCLALTSLCRSPMEARLESHVGNCCPKRKPELK